MNNYKKNIYLLFLCFIIGTVSLGADELTIDDYSPVVRNWDWEDPYNYYIYDLTYPFDDNNQAGGVDIGYNKSCSPERGWELYTRHFSYEDYAGAYNESRGTYLGQKYFALYNKYTGVLRTFIWLGSKDESPNGEYYTTTFYVTGTDNKAVENDHSYFSYEGPGFGSTIATHIAENTSKKLKYGTDIINPCSWYVVDTKLSYDPNISKNKTRKFRYYVEGVKISDLQLEGSFTFNMETSDQGQIDELKGNKPITESPIGKNKFTSMVKGAKSGIEGAESTVNGIAKGMEWLGEKVRPEGTDEYIWEKEKIIAHEVFANMDQRDFKKFALSEDLKDAAEKISKVGKIIPVVGNVIGAVDAVMSFFGLNDKDTAMQEPLYTYSLAEGTIGLKGTITETEGGVPVYIHTPNSYIPSQSQVMTPIWTVRNKGKNIGLYNITKMPIAHVYGLNNHYEKIHYSANPQSANQAPYYTTTTHNKYQDLYVNFGMTTKFFMDNIIINPDSKNVIKEIKVLPGIASVKDGEKIEWQRDGFQTPEYYQYTKLDTAFKYKIGANTANCQLYLKVYVLLYNEVLKKEFVTVKAIKITGYRFYNWGDYYKKYYTGADSVAHLGMVLPNDVVIDNRNYFIIDTETNKPYQQLYNTYYLSPVSSAFNFYTPGSLVNPFTTLTAAFASVPNGATLYLNPGSYKAHIINKPIRLKSNGGQVRLIP